MAQNLAMYVRQPEIDLGKTMRTASLIRATDANTQARQLENERAGMELADYTQQRGALNDYRSALQGGATPEAASQQQLSGYPEMQAKFHEAFLSMEPDKQEEQAKRIRAFGEAAREVASLPDGSSEQRAAWERSVKHLQETGLLTDEQEQSALKEGPSDMLLEEAQTLESWTASAMKQRETQRARAVTEQARQILLGGAPDLIRQEEGFREKAYMDNGSYRAGYGSDTVTRADGTVEAVTPDTVVTREDAERDLQRRLPEFAGTAAKQVGPEVWGRFDDAAQSAMASVAYNYGELPGSVVRAAKTGDPEKLASAIESLSSNPDRRRREAAMIRGGAQGGQAEGTRRQQLLTVASNPDVDPVVRGLAEKLLKEEGDKPRSYDDLSAKDKLSIREAARKEAEAGIPQYMTETISSEDMDARIAAAEDAIKQRLFGGETEQRGLDLPPEISQYLQENPLEDVGAYLKEHPAPDQPIDVPPPAAEMLKQYPKLAEGFDEKYGDGAAAQVLGR